MTTATLSLIRDENVTLDELCRHFGESLPFVAGVVEAVTGNADWRDAQEDEPTAAEREDYQRGFQLGTLLLDADAMDAAHGTFAAWWQALDTAALAS